MNLSAQTGLEAVTALTGVSRETQDRLVIYHDLLVKWQKQINLIAPSTIPEIWTRHIGDSVQTYLLAPEAKTWCDIGSGAGLPGLIIAICLAGQSSGRVDLVESNGKKCAFLRNVVRETGLATAGFDVHVHHDRLETVLPKLPAPDVLTARALASLDKLLDWTQSLHHQRTRFILAKGRDHSSELSIARDKFDFDHVVHQSRFEPDSVILEITNIRYR